MDEWMNIIKFIYIPHFILRLNNNNNNIANYYERGAFWFVQLLLFYGLHKSIIFFSINLPQILSLWDAITLFFVLQTNRRGKENTAHAIIPAKQPVSVALFLQLNDE